MTKIICLILGKLVRLSLTLTVFLCISCGKDQGAADQNDYTDGDNNVPASRGVLVEAYKKPVEDAKAITEESDKRLRRFEDQLEEME